MMSGGTAKPGPLVLLRLPVMLTCAAAAAAAVLWAIVGRGAGLLCEADSSVPAATVGDGGVRVRSGGTREGEAEQGREAGRAWRWGRKQQQQEQQ